MYVGNQMNEESNTDIVLCYSDIVLCYALKHVVKSLLLWLCYGFVGSCIHYVSLESVWFT